jgi:hypothetical protein
MPHAELSGGQPAAITGQIIAATALPPTEPKLPAEPQDPPPGALAIKG